MTRCKETIKSAAWTWQNKPADFYPDLITADSRPRPITADSRLWSQTRREHWRRNGVGFTLPGRKKIYLYVQLIQKDEEKPISLSG